MYTNTVARGTRVLSQRRATVVAAATAATGSGSSTSAWFRRTYAVPVNRNTSVDPLLGIAPPPAPTPQPQTQIEGKQAASQSQHDTAASGQSTLSEILGISDRNNATARSNNPNDISDLLRGKRASSNNRHRNNSSTPSSQEQSRDAASAMGAMRRGAGSAIPTEQLQHDPLEEAATKRDKAGNAIVDEAVEPRGSSDGVVDREHPHSIDALYGRNDLDERILAAARALHHARQQGQLPGKDASGLTALMDAFHTHRERTLSIELPNESRPSQGRRVMVTSALSDEAELEQMADDGVLLIAYVTGLNAARGQERISVCSGFAVEGGDRLSAADSTSNGPLVVTCAHTLRSASSGSSDGGDSSIALAVTRTGQVLPISSLLSSLPTSDLVLLQLGERAIVADDATALTGAPLRTSPISLRTLPVNPYPAPVGSELCVSSFWGWEDDASSVLPAFEFQAPPAAPLADHTTTAGTASSSAGGGGGGGSLMTHSTTSTTATSATDTVVALTVSPKPVAAPVGREKEQVKRERDDAGRSRWGRARLIEYRDASGQEAKTGTYDELAQLDFALLHDNAHNPPALQHQRNAQANWPPPGSSGGPIVDAQSGSVVGVTRGTKMGVLQGRRGDAIPAERIYFMFALPGFGKKSSGGGEGGSASSS